MSLVWQSASPVLMVPLPKGGWHGEAVTGGFLSRRTSCNAFVGAGFYPARGRGRAPPLRTTKKPTVPLAKNLSLRSQCAHWLWQSATPKTLHAKNDRPQAGRLRLSKNLRVFPTKGLRSAARIICPSITDKFHTGSPSCIFSHAHVARENDFISLPPAGGKLCEAFLTR